jgi:hypothetical protein
MLFCLYVYANGEDQYLIPVQSVASHKTPIVGIGCTLFGDIHFFSYLAQYLAAFRPFPYAQKVACSAASSALSPLKIEVALDEAIKKLLDVQILSNIVVQLSGRLLQFIDGILDIPILIQ